MTGPASPFREAVGLCAFCGRESTADELESVARLEVCPRCRAGELDEALAAHGLREDVVILDPRKHSSEVKDHGFKIALTLPVSLLLEAALRPEGATTWFSKLFHKPDPEVGVAEFDERVRVEVDPDHEPLLMAFLESEGAREAVLRLLGAGCRVVGFTNSLLSVVVRKWDPGSVPPIETVKVPLVALAIQLSAFASRELPR